MLFLQAPAETTNYMIAGYTVIFGVMLLYIGSLLLRRKNLKQDLEILQSEENQSQ